MRYVETDKQHGGAVSLATVLGMILTLQMGAVRSERTYEKLLSGE